MKVTQSTQSCLILCNSMEFLATPGNSPGQNTGVGSLSLFQGIFPTQGLNPGLPHCRWIKKRTSLAVQWLRLHTSTAASLGSPLSEELENEDPTCLEAWLKKKKKKAEEENHCDACSLRGGTHPSPKCQTQGRWRTLVEQGGSL